MANCSVNIDVYITSVANELMGNYEAEEILKFLDNIHRELVCQAANKMMEYSELASHYNNLLDKIEN